MPPLTTIRDMLYDATGKPLEGAAILTSPAMLTPDGDLIGASTLTIPITGGNIQAQLVPTTNATPAGQPTSGPIPPLAYQVTIESGGEHLYTQQWDVPPTNQVLTIEDVATT